MRYLPFVLVAGAALGASTAPRAVALPLPAQANKSIAPAPQFLDPSREYSRKRVAAAPVLRRVSVAPEVALPLMHSDLSSRKTRVVLRASSNIARATLPSQAARIAAQRVAAAPRFASLTPTHNSVSTLSTVPQKNTAFAPREYSRGTKIFVASQSASVEVATANGATAKSSAAPNFASGKAMAPQVPASLAASPKINDKKAAAPRLAQSSITKAPLPNRAAPVSPTSRQMDRDRILLAQLERQLRRTQSGLDRADADLNASERQLAAFSSTLQKAMMEAGVDARGLHPFVRVAQKYAGTPYVWGGESRNGFDCSGFIIVVMRELGYKSLPHSAAEQFNYGTPIAQALLKPGDLVFFANTYKPGISHVGIYLGKRRFIHAAGTGIGTIVSSLDSAKFQAKYAGARRLVRAR